MDKDFEIWWKEEGSKMRKTQEGETHLEAVKRTASIAWANGRYKLADEIRRIL